jgi:hypothetical protein
MSYESQNTELKTRFTTVWANRTPRDMPNMKFSLPSPPAPWVRFRISGGDAKRLTIGGGTNWHRNAGIIFVQLFVPIETGDAVITQYADVICDMFRDWCGTNITCRTPVVKEVGPDGSGYFQVNVNIPFHRDELR